MYYDRNIPFNCPTGFAVRTSDYGDVEDLTRLWLSSFTESHDFFKVLTPNNAVTRKWLNDVWIMGLDAGEKSLVTFVVEDLTKHKKLVAFVRCQVPQEDGSQEIPFPDFPAEWDPKLTEELWGGIAKLRASVMGNRIHWMGEFLGVDSAYQHKNLATIFLEWACRQGDAAGLDFYLEATMKGRPIFKHYGFQDQKILTIPARPNKFGAYEVVAMIRPPRLKSTERRKINSQGVWKSML